MFSKRLIETFSKTLQGSDISKHITTETNIKPIYWKKHGAGIIGKWTFGVNWLKSNAVFCYLAQSNRITPFRAQSLSQVELFIYHGKPLTDIVVLFSQLPIIYFITSSWVNLQQHKSPNFSFRALGENSTLSSSGRQFELTLDNGGLGHSHGAYLDILLTLYWSVLGPGKGTSFTLFSLQHTFRLFYVHNKNCSCLSNHISLLHTGIGMVW